MCRVEFLAGGVTARPVTGIDMQVAVPALQVTGMGITVMGIAGMQQPGEVMPGQAGGPADQRDARHHRHQASASTAMPPR